MVYFHLILLHTWCTDKMLLFEITWVKESAGCFLLCSWKSDEIWKDCKYKGWRNTPWKCQTLKYESHWLHRDAFSIHLHINVKFLNSFIHVVISWIQFLRHRISRKILWIIATTTAWWLKFAVWIILGTVNYWSLSEMGQWLTCSCEFYIPEPQ